MSEWHTEVHRKSYQKNLQNFTARLEPKRENPYHKNTLKNMRAAINCYFQNNNIKVDIVNDTKFKSCNQWHTEVYNYGERLNFSKGTPEELSEKLTKFYCEVRTKKGEPLS
ncbi:hypothetical protein KUTeg_023433 [Tegillarca granosa]|uniref:Uncharacterized protein n=1 Tax=Tegillarca granosa TaxID=220873 RepID=A0ABQ9E1P9_TEGGR|nr:hypothetical protein KUTeg_023433 [Tegillarca granosa]